MSMKPSRHTCTKNYTGRQVAPMRDGDATSCLVAGACFANKDALELAVQKSALAKVRACVHARMPPQCVRACVRAYVYACVRACL